MDYEKKKKELVGKYGYEESHPNCEMLIKMPTAKKLFEELEQLSRTDQTDKIVGII